MMGFLDKVKKTFGSKKEDVESQNSVNDEVIDESTFIESIEKDNGNFNDNEEIQSSDSEEIHANDEIDKPTPIEKIRNFKYLDELIHSGAKEIVLDSDIVLGAGEKSEYKEGIRLNVDDLTIDGNGHTIDAQDKTRIFHCTGKNITLKNITLKNGHSHKNLGGGAIYNRHGQCTITGSRLLNNKSEREGGAIGNQEGECSITDCILENNTAKTNGGAIKNYKGKCSITNCELVKNMAKRGSAISNNDGHVNIDGLAFIENSADENGTDILNTGRLYSRKDLSNSILIQNNKRGRFYQIKPLENNQKNFAHLNELASTKTGEVMLENDIVLDIENSEDKIFENGIEIDGADLIIDGNGHSVDAMGGSRIFNCTGQRITLKNIILKNGFAKNGGAICSKCEDLNIVECEIIQNSAGENGGGIYNFNGNITITKSTISNNRAVNGGAIYNWSEIYENAKMTIHDSTLSKNKVEFRGGAIFNLCTMNVSSSTFSDNVALSDGGAILNESNLATSTISGSTFCKNRSFTGGAISNDQGSMMIVSDSILSDNTAWMEGVIYNLEGALRLIKCEVSNNKSWCEKRPTLMDQNSIILNNDYFESNSSIFRDNESKFILKNNSNASLSIIHGEFIDNKSDYVIVNDGNFCLIDRILFENNACLDTLVNHTNLTLRNPKISCNGKTILNEGHLMISEEPSTLLNQIHGEGKMEIEFPQFPNDENFNFCHLDKKIHQSNVREIVLDEDICFGNYETDYYEGGIELDIDNLTIDGNGHTIDGAGKSRIFIVTAKNVTLKNIIFRNGRSHKSYYNPFNSSGGAIRVNFNASLTVENCRFESNISEENGGAICNGGEVNISDSTLSQNTVKNTYNSKFNSEFFALSENAWTGGAICNWGVMNISGSALFENTAGIGGAIINWGVVNIFDSNLFKNTGDRYAGAIQNWAGKLTIYDSTLSKNTVNSMGGAIQNWGGKVAVYSSILSENTAGFGGGAIANRGELTITESTLQENTAQEDGGGAILNEWGGLLIISSTIIDSLFTGNKAARNGGAIYNDRGELSITESTITENTAESRGGAIYLYESKKYESNDCTFKDNKPDDVYEEKD